jgi:L-seryl-tRNA(Ser) seleniumtransferase
MNENPFRNLPSVTEILQQPLILALKASHPRALIVETIRQELSDMRLRLGRGECVDSEGNGAHVATAVVTKLERDLRPKLRPVINATGIVLHTNLGRAPMAEEAARAAYEAARGYLNLELDLETGKRSSRSVAVREWLCRLTGAQSATAVNNNAAATVIALRALCRGQEVIISRGQLIEIGGSFRIPEIMAVSGATLREVGTTNITRLSDYEGAINATTAALMRIHPSNYRVTGFTKSVSLADLVALGKKHGLPVIDDIGSGALFDFGSFGFQGEPVARESITTGADLVLFSGDKLLGGPQAGVLAGRKDLIEKIEKDPLMRAFRLDKMTLAALEATLQLHLSDEKAARAIPTLCMLSMPLQELQQRAENLAGRLRQNTGLASARARQDVSYVGGGSLPDQALKTYGVEVEPKDLSDAELAYRLRIGSPAIVARLWDGKLLLDLRTVFPEQEPALEEALRQAVET